MSASSCQVIFTGALRRGINRREGISQLAQRLGLDFAQIKTLLAAERPVVKHSIPVVDGERLVRAFWQAGWRSELLCNGKLLFDGERHFPGDDQRIADTLESQILFSADRSCSIVVPAGWQTFSDLNNSAVIQAGSLQENQFLVVLAQNLRDLPAATSIAAYCGAQLKQCAAKLSGSEILTSATSLEDGRYPGCFGEIAAEIDALPVQYLIACLECDEKIFTLFFWCEALEYPHRKRDFDRVVLSFCAEVSRQAR